MTSANRRQVLGGLSLAASLMASSSLRAATKPRQKTPNFVFIMADDLGYADLSCTGSSHIKTPAIDSLARDGVQLSQGYANAPICSPTRTALLTGCYQYRFRVGLEEPISGNAPPDIGVPKDRPTLASVLRDRGYRTKLIGKWHLGSPPEQGPLQHGYDEFFGVVEGAADYFRHHMVIHGRDVGMGLTRGNTPVNVNGYMTDLLGDEAVRTIENAGDKPFLISLHFTSPHWPWEGREDAEMAQKIPSSFDYSGGSLKKYEEMVVAMDQNVAKVLAALEKMGLADDTVVVFTSDNGGERFSQTWPFVGHKGELLEGGIRVPVLMRWPGHIAPGSKSDQEMMSMDYLPTFLAMAGGDAGKVGTFDGVDLTAQLTGKAASFQRTLYWRYKANDQAAIREGDWKYLRLGGKEHLFNLAEDEHEQADHINDNPAKVHALRQKWNAWNAQMLPYPLGSFSEDVREHYSDRYSD